MRPAADKRQFALTFLTEREKPFPQAMQFCTSWSSAHFLVRDCDCLIWKGTNSRTHNQRFGLYSRDKLLTPANISVLSSHQLWRFLTHLERLVLSAELLHGRRRVVQLPPQLHHLRLQLLDLAFALYTPRTQPHGTQWFVCPRSLIGCSGSFSHHRCLAGCIISLLINTFDVKFFGEL